MNKEQVKQIAPVLIHIAAVIVLLIIAGIIYLGQADQHNQHTSRLNGQASAIYGIAAAFEEPMCDFLKSYKTDSTLLATFENDICNALNPNNEQEQDNG